MDRILNMIFRRLLNRGIRAGIDRAASGGKTREEMTAEEREGVQNAQTSGRRAQQAMRMARRAGRF